MTWISAKQVAELLGKTERTIQYSVKSGFYMSRYVNGIGRGGRVLQVALESLPQEAQDLYNGVLNESDPRAIMEYTTEQREDAEYKAWVVQDYWNSGLSVEKYIMEHNAHPVRNPISKAQLFRWQKQYRDSREQITALVDRRGGHNKGESSISPVAWDYFYSLYMTTQKRKIQRCYEFTRHEFPDIPSVSAFERRVRQIPFLAMTLYREGEQAFKNHLPYMQRDYTAINANDIWYSDEHTMDIFVKNKLGKPTRYYLTMWFDARSRKPMSYILQPYSATTDTIKRSLRMAMQDNGVPNALYVDNGSVYKSQDGLNRDYPLSLVSRLNMRVIYAKPYNPKGKGAMERFFGTLEDRFGRMFPTYCGSDYIDKPEYLQRPVSKPEKYLAQHAPSEEEFLQAFDNYIEEYCETPHTGQGMAGKTPNQVYAEAISLRKVVSDKEALRLICGRVETRTVRQNGIQILERFYRHDALAMYQKEKVIAIYDPDNLNEMNIFTQAGKAICIAKPDVLVTWQPSAEDYRQAQREKKQIRKAMRDYKPLHDKSTFEIMAETHLKEAIYERTQDTQTAEVYSTMIAESRKLADMKKVESEQTTLKNDAQQLQREWMDFYNEGGLKNVSGST